MGFYQHAYRAARGAKQMWGKLPPKVKDQVKTYAKKKFRQYMDGDIVMGDLSTPTPRPRSGSMKSIKGHHNKYLKGNPYSHRKTTGARAVRRSSRGGKGVTNVGVRKEGKWTGVFKASGRSPRHKVYSKGGTVHRFEEGGWVEDAECVYLGQGASGDRLKECMGDSLCKFLYESLGFNVANLENQVPEHGQFKFIRESTGTRSDNADFVLNVVPDDTFRDIGTLMMSTIWSNTSLGIETSWHSIEYWRLDQANELTVTVGFLNLKKEWPFKKIKFNYKFESTMTIQNVTQSGVTGETERMVVDNVAQNPLKGYIYTQKKRYQNGFHWAPKFNTHQNGTDHPTIKPGLDFVADAANGIIHGKYASLKPADGDTFQFMKPPSGHEFGWGVTADRVTLQPGEIKKLKLVENGEQTLFDWVSKNTMYYKNSEGLDQFLRFGHANMVAFEKSLDSRATGGSNVKIDFELNQVYSFRFYCKKQPKRTDVYTYVAPSAAFTG